VNEGLHASACPGCCSEGRTDLNFTPDFALTIEKDEGRKDRKQKVGLRKRRESR